MLDVKHKNTKHLYFKQEDVSKIVWHKQSIFTFLVELQNFSREYNISLSILNEALKQSSITPLDDNTWENIVNSVTFSINNSIEYNTYCKVNGLNCDQALNAFKDKDIIPCPVIVNLKGRYYVIKNEENLATARLKRVRPLVVILNLE